MQWRWGLRDDELMGQEEAYTNGQYYKGGCAGLGYKGAIMIIIILFTSSILSGDLFRLTYPGINYLLTNPFNYKRIILTALVS